MFDAIISEVLNQSLFLTKIDPNLLSENKGISDAAYDRKQIIGASGGDEDGGKFPLSISHENCDLS